MPVELPVIVNDEPHPTPPSAFIWLALFVVVMLAGVVTTLLTWPKGEPTSTPWFWTCLLVFPALTWCVAFGLRKNHYEQEIDRIEAEEAVRKEDRQEAIEFASEPLVVIASAYRCATGDENVAKSILDGDMGLTAQVPRLGTVPVRHSALVLDDDGNDHNRYTALFNELLNSLHESLAALPPDIPFDVRLQFPMDIPTEKLLSLWNACWNEMNLRSVQPTLLPADQGLMALDQWLDLYGGPELQKLTLFVAVQLHDDPPVDSAEAGVAMLLCWPLVAEHKKLDALAALHRPLETTSTTLDKDIPIALLWGKADNTDVKHIWQTGLTKEEKAALNTAASEIKLGATGNEDLSGVHDVDTALGHPGAAASWLAAALAIENARKSQEPQMIACHEGTLRLAVVQPITNQDESKTTQ